MEISDVIGSAAALFTTISFIPQALKVIKTRDTRSISLGMYTIFSGGVTLWLVYGIMKHDMPIIIANAVTLVFALTILWFKAAEPKTPHD